MDKPTTVADLLKLPPAQREALGVSLTPKGVRLLRSLSECPICERRRAAIEKAKQEGRCGPKSGKPPIGNPIEAQRLRAEGLSYRKIAERLKISRQTALRYCQTTSSGDAG